MSSTYSKARSSSPSPLLSLISEGGKLMLSDATVNQELKKVNPYVISKQSVPTSLLQGSGYVDFELNSGQNIDLLRTVFAEITVQSTSASSITLVSPLMWLEFVSVMVNGSEVSGARYPPQYMFDIINSVYSTEELTSLADAGNWSPTTFQPANALGAGATATYRFPIFTFLDLCQVPLHPNIIYTLRFQFNGGPRLKVSGSGLVSEVNVTDFRLLLDGICAHGQTKKALEAKLLSQPYLCRALLPGSYKPYDIGAMTAGSEYQILMTMYGKMAGFFVTLADGATGAALQYTFAQLNRVDIRGADGQSYFLFDSGADNDVLLRKLLPVEQFTNPSIYRTLNLYPLIHSDSLEDNILDNSSHGSVRYNNVERIYIEPTGNVTAGVLWVYPLQEHEITINYGKKSVVSNADC